MNRRKVLQLSFNSLAYASVFSTLGSSLFSCVKEIQNTTATLEVLNSFQAQILSIIADLIIPKSDSPAATEVGVVAAIDQYLKHFFSEANQKQILSGLELIDQLSQQALNKPFLELNSNEQKELMSIFSNDASRTPDPSTHLFFALREMVVRAYFQSEVVAKSVLKYDPIPKEYKGCVSLDEIGGQWVL